MKKTIWIIGLLFVLGACGGQENMEKEDTNENSDVVNVIPAEITTEEETLDEVAVDRDTFSVGDDIKIEGTVKLSEADMTLYVSGETNLLEGTMLAIDVHADPYTLIDFITQDFKVEVYQDGTFTRVFELEDDFF